MFDLDRLAAFDRGLAALPTRARAAPPLAAAAEPAAPVMRCTMTERLGVEPLCPFARIEAA
ncbi:MAG: hypothetical protein N2Z62_09840 [Rhodobacteraceae bacterium]|nr:hypothetical protein [Paracoccaceae bacterium]